MVIVHSEAFDRHLREQMGAVPRTGDMALADPGFKPQRERWNEYVSRAIWKYNRNVTYGKFGL